MRQALIALGLVAALGAAGCASNGDAKAGEQAQKKTAKPASSSSTTQPFVANTKNTPGTLKNFVGAHADVHDTSCKQGAGSWVAHGKLTNSSKTRASYRVYVSFLNGDTTVGLSQTDVTSVAPGATQDWTGSVNASGKDLRCILRVERAPA